MEKRNHSRLKSTSEEFNQSIVKNFKLDLTFLRSIFNFSFSGISNIVIFYIGISYLVFRWGPIEFSHRENNGIIFLLIVYILAIKLGFILGGKFKLYDDNDSTILFSNHWLLRRQNIIITLGLKLGILISVWEAMNLFGNNPILIFNYLLNSVFNPSIGYSRLQQLIGVSEVNILLSMSHIFLTFLVYFSLVNSISKWKSRTKITRVNKILTITYILMRILSAILIGTNFVLFSLAIFIIIPLLFSNNSPRKGWRVNKERKIIFTLLLTIGLSVIFFFFHTISSRLNWTSIPESFLGVPINHEHILMKFPSQISNGIIIFTFYLANGFNGFAIAQTMPLVSTFGFGFGRIPLSLGRRILGLELNNRTFLYRMQDYWHPTLTWHTAFTWFANDFGFIFVSVQLFFISFVFAMLLKDAIIKGNLIAKTLIPFYVIFFIFLPLNNIIFSAILGYPFAILHIWWVLPRIFSYRKLKLLSNKT